MRFAILALLAAIALPAHAFTFQYLANPIPNVSAIDFSYRAEVDLSGDSFSVSGVAFYGSFRNKLGDPPVPGTGLGTAYGLYSEFHGVGALTQIAPGVVRGDFSNFQMNLAVDPLLDTRSLSFTPGPGGGNESVFATNTGDDSIILTGNLLQGQTHNILDLNRGSFNILVDPTGVSPIIAGLAGPLRFSGVSTAIDGLVVPPGVAVDLDLTGSGNLAAVVPEPQTPLMVGVGAFLLLILRKLRAHE